MSEIIETALKGEAWDLYKAWCRLGHTKAEALDEVRRSGILEEQAMQAATSYVIEVVSSCGGEAARVDVSDTYTAIAALTDMAVGEVLTIRRTR